LETEARLGNDSAGIKELDADSAGRLASVIAALLLLPSLMLKQLSLLGLQVDLPDIVATTVEIQREHATAVLVQSNSVDGTFD
jgi:hypothetical protein